MDFARLAIDSPHGVVLMKCLNQRQAHHRIANPVRSNNQNLQCECTLAPGFSVYTVPQYGQVALPVFVTSRYTLGWVFQTGMAGLGQKAGN